MTRSIEIQSLIEGFRLYCMAEGKQPNTVRWYMSKLKIFQKLSNLTLLN